jgi:hypothetical protein
VLAVSDLLYNQQAFCNNLEYKSEQGKQLEIIYKANSSNYHKRTHQDMEAQENRPTYIQKLQELLLQCADPA